jgi:hypothetical protein
MDDDYSDNKIEKCPKCGWPISDPDHWGEPIKPSEEAENQ